MITLYQYQHCPFCLRADMVANYLDIRHQKVYLLNNDEETSMRLINKKSVPILELEDGTAISDSEQIVNRLQAFSDKKFISDQVNHDEQLEALHKIKNDIDAMLFPRTILIKQPEFSTQSARNYYQSEKEALLGMSFDTAMDNSKTYQAEIEKTLSKMTDIVLPSQHDDSLSWADLYLYPWLRNLTMIKNIKMRENQRNYLEEISVLTNTIGYSHRAQ
ncbi:glutaredoxin 2 [Salinimonas sp. HHU 13199]|uniref:Glutaredoxin 2 n=1 Tax=Salinimonas profundi TaxID=2729140 RepID=A0ABR8LSC5_9ALTE|nr:glutaredoxin 2 [Salinimonas profundi]MBD3586999.1 glutaredoxin 2 [Salinimonas profundi]